MSDTKNSEGSALSRVVNLPLVSSTLQMITSVYVGAKRQYPLLDIVGGVTELSVRSVSTAASQRAAPLLQRLEPEIDTVNGFALFGLEKLEKRFPVLHQSADEVIDDIKERFVLTMGNVQARVNEELDSVVDRWEKVLAFTRDVLEAAQASPPGQILIGTLDEILTRSEEAVDYYLPLPPSLRREWEIRVQRYEDDDVDEEEDDAEPHMWTRFRSLLLFLYLQLYHRFQQLKERVDSVLEFLVEAADVVGLTGLMEGVWSLLQLLLSLYTDQVQRVMVLRSLLLDQFWAGVQMLRELLLIQKLQTLPAQVRTVMEDLLELGQILIQLIINTTPLYDMVQQSSDQNVPDFNLPDGTSRRSSGNSLFLKAMDGRPRRRRSLYARYRRSSFGSSAANTSPAQALAPTPASTSAPVSSSTPATAPSPALKPDEVTTLESAPNPKSTQVHNMIQDLDPIEAQDEVPNSNLIQAQEDVSDPKLTEVQIQEPESSKAPDKAPDSCKGSQIPELIDAQDKISEIEPTEDQDKISDLYSVKSQEELSDPEPTEADDEPKPKLIEAIDEVHEPELFNATAEAPDSRKSSLKQNSQQPGSLEPDSDLIDTQDKISEAEPTEDQSKISDLDSTESQDELEDPEPAEAEDQQQEPNLIESLGEVQESEPTMDLGKAPDSRKSSLKQNSQQPGSVEADLELIDAQDKISEAEPTEDQRKISDLDSTESQDELEDPEPAEAEDQQQEPNLIESLGEVQESEPTMDLGKAPDSRKSSLKQNSQQPGSVEADLELIDAQDKISEAEPTEDQRKISDLDSTESQDELSDAEPAEAEDELLQPKLIEALESEPTMPIGMTPDSRKGSLKQYGQPRGSLGADLELTDAEDKMFEAEPTEDQSKISILYSTESQDELSDAEPAEAEDELLHPKLIEALESETTMPIGMAPDSRKGSLKQYGQPRGSLGADLELPDAEDKMFEAEPTEDQSKISILYSTESQDELSDVEPAEAEDELLQPKLIEALESEPTMPIGMAPDSRKGSLKQYGQPRGSLGADLELPDAEDKMFEAEPTEDQSKISILYSTESQDELSDVEPAEAEDELLQPKLIEALESEPTMPIGMAPDSRKGSLKQYGQPRGSLGADLELPDAEDKMFEAEPTEDQSKISILYSTESQDELSDVEPAEAEDELLQPKLIEALESEPTMPIGMAPDSRKGSLKQYGQPRGSLGADLELIDAEDKRSEAKPTEEQHKISVLYSTESQDELSDAETAEAEDELIEPKLIEALDTVHEPEPTEAIDKAPDSRKNSLTQYIQQPGFLEADLELTDAQDKISETEPTEDQSKISVLYSTESQDELSDTEPAEVEDEFPEPQVTEPLDEVQESEPTMDPAKAADGRKASLTKDGQPAESLDLDATTLPSSTMVRRRSSARELLLSPIIQFVTQSQRAFEYLASTSYSEGSGHQ